MIIAICKMDSLILISSTIEFTHDVIGTITRYHTLYDEKGSGISDCKSSLWRADKCECLVLYLQNYVLIESIKSYSSGHGKILLQYVLNVLISESNTTIRLIDFLTINLANNQFPLQYISFFTRGEFSWYSQFGFQPLIDPDTQQNLMWIHTYQSISKEIKSLKRDKAIDVMCQFKDKYDWLTSVINHLKNCDQNLMIDSMKSYDFSKLAKHDKIHGLEEIFNFEFPSDEWFLLPASI